MATHTSILAWRIPMDRGAWRATVHEVTKESDSTEQLSKTQHILLGDIVLDTTSFDPNNTMS